MSKFNKIKTPIKDLNIIEPISFEDDRGFFLESYNMKEFQKLGITERFVQDNHSRSVKGVLRGLHFQINEPQGKLVRVVKGSIFDVVVDLRRGSPNFAEYYGVELTEWNMKMLFIPEGFAHGFLAISEEVDLIYKVTDYFIAEYDRGIIWKDPTINIYWPIKKYGIKKPILSEKDKNLPKMNDINIPFNYKERKF